MSRHRFSAPLRILPNRSIVLVFHAGHTHHLASSASRPLPPSPLNPLSPLFAILYESRHRVGFQKASTALVPCTCPAFCMNRVEGSFKRLFALFERNVQGPTAANPYTPLPVSLILICTVDHHPRPQGTHPAMAEVGKHSLQPVVTPQLKLLTIDCRSSKDPHSRRLVIACVGLLVTKTAPPP